MTPTHLEEVLALLDAAPRRPDGAPRVLAIDGRAAAGKSTLAAALAERLGPECGVVHADHFFLPPELRTPERRSQPGGNIHYERLQTEVIPFLHRPEAFAYRPFSCQTGALADTPVTLPACHAWRILEGSYALHPALGHYCDLALFLDITPEEQLRRITLRNGPAKAAVFQSLWIPLEEEYIRAHQPHLRAHVMSPQLAVSNSP